MNLHTNLDLYSHLIATYSSDSARQSLVMSPGQQPMATAPIIAQADVGDEFFGRSGDILGNFVDSGQVWALLIGLMLGYFIRGMTSY